MSEDKKDKSENLNDPAAIYGREIRFFSSFQEEEEYNLKYAASLSPNECMQQMRKLINFTYAMHGIDMNQPPTQHHIIVL